MAHERRAGPAASAPQVVSSMATAARLARKARTACPLPLAELPQFRGIDRMGDHEPAVFLEELDVRVARLWVGHGSIISAVAINSMAEAWRLGGRRSCHVEDGDESDTIRRT